MGFLQVSGHKPKFCTHLPDFSKAKHHLVQAGLIHCSYDILLKAMHWNPYETNVIVEPVFQVKTTVKYKKPRGPCKDAGWGGG